METRTCRVCEIKKPKSEYAPSVWEHGKRLCRNCGQIQNKKYFHSEKGRESMNKYRRSDKAKKLGKEYRQKRKNMWREWFINNGYGVCSKCGYNEYFEAIEFHHRDPSTKKIYVCEWVQKRGCTTKNQQIIKQEIDKCDVLCANCHRKTHKNKKEEKIIITRQKWITWFKDNGYNKCSRCGYDKCFDVIEFHHEEEKFFTVAQFTGRRVCSPKNQRLLEPELKKCIVLCANCHREEHYKMGITDVK